MNEPIVKVEHLSHRYSVQWAVRDVSFEIPTHGIYGLLGSNGAGKSTLMNIMCGVMKQTEGKAYIKGIDTSVDPVASKRLIGFLPQKPPLYNDLSVEEYLSFTARLRWMPKNEVKTAVEEVMEKCALTHFRKRVIKNLSGGYQQRVGIAQAIIHKPQLVVLDEPTNGLDPNQIIEIRSLIRQIAEERTVILSTHILSEVQAICDEIMMIEEGQMVFKGTVSDFDNYIAPSTIYASFIESLSADTLASIEGVLKVDELGGKNFRIYFNDAQDVMDRVVEQSFKHKWRLSEIRVEKNELNAIFAELSKKKSQ
ncbi:MAG: ABC transporter ATP-binding protein [Rikenellaceae bacterium]|nr:ABC transporter ATP-binding protein [Rikenellaceae bacterium]MCL2693128.1 ABC transporter ATP-binding protein [Rikenellaceae bacterium]